MIQCSPQIRIRPLYITEIGKAVETHRSAFPHFFLSFLGPPFLGLLYRSYIQGKSEIAMAAEYGGKIVGVIIGTSAPARFYKRLATRHFVRFACASIIPIMSQPPVLFRLIRALVYRGDVPSGIEGGALLASVCVSPQFMRLGIGKKLVDAFEAEMWDRGARFIYLLTNRDNNLAAQTFYEKTGWIVESEFSPRQARVMRRYFKWRQDPVYVGVPQ